MCGISGFANYRNAIEIGDYYAAHLKLRHRGTDDEGFFVVSGSDKTTYRGNDTVAACQGLPHINSINSANIIMGSHRLAIIDRSSDGHQPLQDKHGHLTIIFNGEIYNYIELREELVNLGREFSTNSDTEVILHAYAQWGLNSFNRFNGMWALAIHDSRSNQLLLCRDRFGVKPLYYTIQNGTLFFGSEVKFILPFVRSLKVNEKRAIEYLVQNLVDHHSETMFAEIHQVLPGNYCVWSDRGLVQEPYYSLQVKKANRSLTQAQDELSDLLTSSINIRLRADVPVGSLLSGGLDSTTITCLAKTVLSQSASNNTFELFSAVFPEEQYSEKKYIEETVSRVGFNIHWVYPNPSEFISTLPQLLHTQEFPFRSLSVFLQWEIMRQASGAGAKVLFDGQGSDEIFGGYTAHYYSVIAEYLRQFKINQSVRHLRAVSRSRDVSILQALFGSLYNLLKFSALYKPFSTRNIRYLAQAYRHDDNWIHSGDMFDNALLRNLKYSALPEYLRYDDRNSMAFTIETRLPFMDYRIIEWAFSIPMEYKIDGDVSKRILRDIARPVIPTSISNRKDKMGFISPQEVWQRNDLAGSIRNVFSNGIDGRFPFLIDRECKEKYLSYTRGNGKNWPWIWRVCCLTWWHQYWFEHRARFDD